MSVPNYAMAERNGFVYVRIETYDFDDIKKWYDLNLVLTVHSSVNAFPITFSLHCSANHN